MKKKHMLRYIIILLFILFATSYIVSETGYYEYELQSKMVMTRDKILEFEKDIDNNLDIDIKKYYQEEKDYSNKFTNSINNTSNSIKKYSRKIMKRVFKVLNNYFSD